MFLSHLPKNGKIIDAGCGFGKWVLFLTNRGYNIKGVDNNRLAIKKLKEFNNSLQVEYGDILKLQYPDNSFDAYISMGVVEHFQEGPSQALKEAYRVLKPSGLIFISTPMVNTIRKLIIQPILNLIIRLYLTYQIWIKLKKQEKKKPDLINSRDKKDQNKKYYHFLEYRFTVEEVQNFMEKSNFTVLRTIPHDFHDSKSHCIGLGVDFPFLKTRNSINFELNFLGKLLTRIFERISPWIASASVLCIGKSLKRAKRVE